MNNPFIVSFGIVPPSQEIVQYYSKYGEKGISWKDWLRFEWSADVVTASVRWHKLTFDADSRPGTPEPDADIAVDRVMFMDVSKRILHAPLSHLIQTEPHSIYRLVPCINGNVEDAYAVIAEGIELPLHPYHLMSANPQPRYGRFGGSIGIGWPCRLLQNDEYAIVQIHYTHPVPFRIEAMEQLVISNPSRDGGFIWVFAKDWHYLVTIKLRIGSDDGLSERIELTFDPKNARDQSASNCVRCHRGIHLKPIAMFTLCCFKGFHLDCYPTIATNCCFCGTRVDSSNQAFRWMTTALENEDE